MFARRVAIAEGSVGSIRLRFFQNLFPRDIFRRLGNRLIFVLGLIATTFALMGAPPAKAADLSFDTTNTLSRSIVYGQSGVTEAQQVYIVNNTSGRTIYYPVTYYFGTQGTQFYTYTNGPSSLTVGATAVMIVTIPTASYSLPAGTYAGAIDLGDAGNLSLGLIDSRAITLTINKGDTTTALSSSLTPSAATAPVTLTATVNAVAPSSGTRTGTVSFYDGATLIDTVGVNAGGVATLVTSGLAVGTRSLTATYNGDNNFNGSTSSTISQVVEQASTQAAVVSAANPSVFGQTASLTATISAVAPAAGVPTGTVSFFDGATLLGSTALSGGQATLSSSALSVGAHSITVSYAGDANFVTSVSNALSQTVNQSATTSTLTSSANPSVNGQKVTLTATVAATSPGAGTPAGTVTFKNGATTLGTANLNGSAQATFTTAALPAGAQSLTATFEGDTNFVSSTSAPLSQTVNPAASVLLMASAAAPSIFGDPLAFTARVFGGLPAPSGNVTVKDGPTTLGNSPLISTGVGRTIAAGRYFTCAIDSTMALSCWGDNTSGQLGDGSNVSKSAPTPVSTLGSNVISVVAGASHACALNSSGGVLCWGDNSYGQLGDGTFTSRSAPTAIPSLASGVVTLTAGPAFTCALTRTGQVQCWGDNTSGQLGDGSQTNRESPVAVASLTGGVTEISAGADHTCALTATNGVKCWGGNAGGQLGNGSNDASLSPVAVSGLSSGVIRIASGSGFTCAALSNGAAKCWGSNANGELGNGGSADSNLPTDVAGMTTAATVAAGNETPFACALESSGTASCWGSNTSGQLGNGSVTPSATPVPVSGFTGGLNLALGSGHVCAQLSDGAVNCWGDNSYGQLGDGTATPRLAPGADVAALSSLGVSRARFATSSLSSGSHDIEMSFPAGASLLASSDMLTQDVLGVTTTTTLASSANPSVSGQSITFTATVTSSGGTPDGTVAFTIGSTNFGALTLTGGVATLTIPSPPVGTYDVSAVYTPSSSDFDGSSATLSGGQTVNRGQTTTTLVSSANPSVGSQTITFTATVAPVSPAAGTPTGTVMFSVGATTTPISLDSNGQATITITPNAVNFTLGVTYNGDTAFAGGSTASVSQVVSPASAAVIVTPSPATSVPGQSVTFTATLAPIAPATATPGGTVTFTIDNVAHGPVTLVSGVASFTTNALRAGSHSVSVAYSGDAAFGTASQTISGGYAVSKGDVTATLAASPVTSVSGQPVTFTATVAALAPATGTPTGTAIFTIDGTPRPPVALSGGIATLATSGLPVGSHTVSVAYSGDADFNTGAAALSGGQTTSKGDTTTTVATSAATPVFGQNVTLTATIAATSPAAGTPTGTATFTIDGTPRAPVALVNGVASLSDTTLAVGLRTVSVAYSGDSAFNTSTGSLAGGVNVGKGPTTTTLTSSLTPSTLNETITLTASVTSSAGTPTGTVVFRDGAAVIGSVALSGTAATFTTSSLAIGGHSITASYEGDATYATSTSAALLQTVIIACNDTFANATPLSILTATAVGSTVAATAEPGEPNHAGVSGPSHSVWCRWQATTSGTTSFDTTGSDFDTVVAVYTGSSVGGLTLIAANDNISPTTRQSRVRFNAVAGTTYTVSVDGAHGAAGDYVLTWSQAPPTQTIMAAVLPTSRSVATGTPATAFATIVNGGSVQANDCGLSLPPGFPGTFTFQTTNEINARVGEPDMPAGIPPGGRQGYVFGIVPTIDLDAVEVALAFTCSNTPPAVSVPGLNTLTLSAAPVATPDLIAISATPSNDGILNLPADGSYAPFAVAAVNIGAAGNVTATTDDGGAGLPLDISLCRTEPATGTCINPGEPGPASTSPFATNETGTFTVFLRATGPVSFDPANNRLIFRLQSADGVTRGSTSVAVRTQ